MGLRQRSGMEHRVIISAKVVSEEAKLSPQELWTALAEGKMVEVVLSDKHYLTIMSASYLEDSFAVVKTNKGVGNLHVDDGYIVTIKTEVV